MRFLFLAAFFQFSVSAWGEPGLPVAESVLIDKSERKMWLITEGRKYREYDISLGDSPMGHKEREGDEKTPEGKYVIDYRNPDSRYHLSLHINYPLKQDEEKARKKGISPGGNIFIHGLPNGSGYMAREYKGVDWTDGCIAVNNQEIEEIWQLVKDGTTIEISR
jgi:murein L,D-transpeptidase YafK